jgi:hypothetical protein
MGRDRSERPQPRSLIPRLRAVGCTPPAATLWLPAMPVKSLATYGSPRATFGHGRRFKALCQRRAGGILIVGVRDAGSDTVDF